ncbi:MAG TPA: VWA domain-containing protein, partial [Methylomirabilota bacterium]|nr:VWA domain-containing protein [Methylomirabilota bacterium]
MRFLTPEAFWFAASIPVVILFYLLKRKRIIQVVSSTLLWQRFLAENQANAPFQKLRKNWLLFLQLLLLLLAILALARPYFSGKSSGGRMIVAIIDASASMQSADAKPTRFDVAKEKALELVRSLHDTDEMVLLVSAANTEVKQSATSEKGLLRTSIQQLRPTDAAGRINEALKLAETLIQNRQKPEIHLFSDGAYENLEEFESRALPLSYHRIGEGANNVGIVNMDVRANPDNPSQRAVFATVQNFSSNRWELQAELRFEDAVVEVKPITLAPGEASPQVFITSQAKDGVFTLMLSGDDDLKLDNRAQLVSLLPQPVKTLLVTPGNRFLEKALKAAPNVLLEKAATYSGDASQYDLVVLDTLTPPEWPNRNVLAFGIAPTNLFAGGAKELESPVVVDWKGSHPLLRFVTFDNVQVGTALGVQTPTWAMSLVESHETPLLLAGDVGKQRVVWVGFDSVKSTWPLRVSFPIFIANAVEWLNPSSIQAAQLNLTAGQPLRLGLQDHTEAQITLPSGASVTRAIDPARGELVFGETQQQGVYRLKAGTNNLAFCVSLLNQRESDITPKSELQFGTYAKAAATTVRQANLEFWRWIALGGLL